MMCNLLHPQSRASQELAAAGRPSPADRYWQEHPEYAGAREAEANKAKRPTGIAEKKTVLGSGTVPGTAPGGTILGTPRAPLGA